MTDKKEILCVQCKEAIQSREELAVPGKTLQPYHRACFLNPGNLAGRLNRFNGAFPVGMRFWLWLVLGNAVAGGICWVETDSPGLLYGFIVLCNLIFILARIGIYVSYERHLPKTRDQLIR